MSEFVIKAAALSPRLALANPLKNAERQAAAAEKAAAEGCNFIVFPAMSLCGATCGDLLYSPVLLGAQDEALALLAEKTAKLDAVIVTGAAGAFAESLVFVIYKGQTCLAAGETFTSDDMPGLPFDFMVINGNCQEESAGTAKGLPAAFLDAKPLTAEDLRLRPYHISGLSGMLGCGIVYANAGPGESSGEGIYGGECIIAINGKVLAASPLLKRDGSCALSVLSDEIPACRKVDEPFAFTKKDPFVPRGEKNAEEYCALILEMQAAALAERLERSYSRKAIVGVSGGSDSTLALLASARAMELLGRPASEVLAITMPGFGTSSRTKGNAWAMMEALGCETREIPIGPAVLQHFKDIGQDPENRDVTYENAQARERTQILMDLANKDGGLVVGTGDISESSLGWCTYNGDHMAMYSVNCGLTKGLVKRTIKAAADMLREGTSPFGPDKDAEKLAACLYDVLDTPVSPELLPTDSKGNIAQKTEDKVGPYELHDFFLYHILMDEAPSAILKDAKKAFAGSYSAKEVEKWLKVFTSRFFSQQFKRSCCPEGPRLVQVSLSPRGAWNMPSDADGSLWKELR